ncbi:FecR domain-containing protein [Sphingomonas sp. 67-41]|nr:FecR domain-containing protein [Sphingomonas sp. 67-41]MBN8811076.1 FecR domain-containing protein [Sphingomonas sp.]OJY54557.1 MAG: hypothetical protein BGP17_05910 [Sphingomonas sp. 67-41]
MTSEAQGSARARAIEWHIRLRHGDDAAWEAFAEWLAEDPVHAALYDEIEQADLALEPLLPAVTFREAANDTDIDDRRQSPRWRWWGLGGGAAAAAVAAMLVLVPQATNSRYEVATGPGQRRTISLEAGTQVTLNGATRMRFDRKDRRFAALEAGEALFQVQHDGARPFTLEVAGRRVVDVGTVFNVVRDARAVRVAVAEGKVLYESKGRTISLDAGQAVLDTSSAEAPRVSRTAIGSVGAWRKGRLVYSGEPLAQVAADLGRALGMRITPAPDVADRPFSGTIALRGTGPAELERLTPALNVTFRPDAGGWTMTAAGAER